MAPTLDYFITRDEQGRILSTVAPDQTVHITDSTALLITDLSTAFMPDHAHNGVPIGGGGLAVKEADQTVAPALAVARKFRAERRYKMDDIHPSGHIGYAASYDSFIDERVIPFVGLKPEFVEKMDARAVISPYFDRDYLLYYTENCVDNVQVLWWQHGLQNSDQAGIHPALRQLKFRSSFVKGMDPKCDSYSPFMDNLRRSTGLGETMQRHGVKKLVTCGLAYDICAGLGALHSAENFGFETYIVKPACRSVSLAGELAMDEKLVSAGVHIITPDQLHSVV